MRPVILCLALLLTACASLPRREPALDVIHQYHAALNRRDLLALTAYVTPDVQWYSQLVDDRVLEVAGREALADAFRAHFARHEETNWSVEAATVHGNSIAVREKSTWRTANESDARITLCVYELLDGRIRRITVYLTAS